MKRAHRFLRRQVAAVLRRLEPYAASLAIHAGLALLALLLIPMSEEKKPDPLAIDFVSSPRERFLPPEPERAAEPQAAPALVPEAARIVKVARDARAFSPEAKPSPERPELPSNPAFVPRFEIAMGATVEGSGVVVATTSERPSNVMTDPGRAGVPGLSGPIRLDAIDATDAWEITREPKPLNDHAMKPAYPPAAKDRGEEGEVWIELLIDASGQVGHARVLRSSDADFEPAALAYCQRLRFAPAEANGRPVPTRITWEVAFRYRNE